MMKRPFVISILNQKLTVQSDADEQYVNRVAGFVNSKVQEVVGKAKTASTLTASLLACLNIADEFFRYQEKKRNDSLRVSQKVRDLICMIDLHSNGGPSGL